jgi:hypothetical protein
MRSVLVLSVVLSACAGAPRASLSGPRPSRVVVVAKATAVPPARSVTDAVVGPSRPDELIARQAEQILTARGYALAGPAVLVDAVPTPARLQALAGERSADGVLVVVLERLELGALRPLGKAEVSLQARLLDARGTALWTGEHRGATRVATYRASSDWRSHLRTALDRSLGDLP